MRKHLILGMLAAGFVIHIASTAASAGFTGTFLTSGQPILALIDGDGDGPDSDDCTLTAILNAGLLTITANQDQNTPLAICAQNYLGSFFADTDDSSAYAGGAFDNFPFLPVGIEIEIIDEQPDPQSLPVRWDDPRDFLEVDLLENGMQVAVGTLCRSDGRLLLRIDILDGTIVLEVPLEIVDVAGKKYLLASDVELDLVPSGTDEFDIYIPLNDDETITFAVGGGTPATFIDIDFDQIPSCSPGVGAPIASPSGLLVLGVALVLFGSWSSRRGKPSRWPGFLHLNGAVPLASPARDIEPLHRRSSHRAAQRQDRLPPLHRLLPLRKRRHGRCRISEP